MPLLKATLRTIRKSNSKAPERILLPNTCIIPHICSLQGSKRDEDEDKALVTQPLGSLFLRGFSHPNPRDQCITPLFA